LLGISCEERYLQLRYFVQVCSSSLLPFSNVVERLAFLGVDGLQHTQWGPTAEDFIEMFASALGLFTRLDCPHRWVAG
jgi:hypothetical protein